MEEQRVNVIIDITSPRAEWAALGDGYRVGVRAVARSEAHAVFVLDGGRARLQPVRLAARKP